MRARAWGTIGTEAPAVPRSSRVLLRPDFKGDRQELSLPQLCRRTLTPAAGLWCPGRAAPSSRGRASPC